MLNPPVFYALPGCRNGDTITLPAVEHRHATKVLRLGKGEPVIVVDGLGMAYRGEISSSPRAKETTVHIHSELRNYGEPSVALTLAAGMSTGAKFDTIVEKGTELGVKRFVPILSETSKVKFEDEKRVQSRIRRLEKVAVAAMKQCRRSYRPDISRPVSYSQFIRETDTDSLNLLFHPSTASTPFEQVSIPDTFKRVTIMIGPESGFTRDELSLALEAGFQPVRLGVRILRTETAGPVACALVMNALGELR